MVNGLASLASTQYQCNVKPKLISYFSNLQLIPSRSNDLDHETVTTTISSPPLLLTNSYPLHIERYRICLQVMSPSITIRCCNTPIVDVSLELDHFELFSSRQQPKRVRDHDGGRSRRRGDLATISRRSHDGALPLDKHPNRWDCSRTPSVSPNESDGLIHRVLLQPST